ncbi:protein phosphatase CheZ [Noviherbaspirillum pedocola]|uniref:Protein phosphatase CheZ n=1 Tax=Noviherbaspirillum pedocola TaxID=2801341 RepID=A0A934SSD6_9BURK|nr:protein phosphatase CheZ [Noviherbaspirillum pedocola]MBK4734600.1 protein phosphatase CheZ [Noviherbaspirillum pedocola]
MNDITEDLEALFDEVSAQHAASPAPANVVQAAAAEPADAAHDSGAALASEQASGKPPMYDRLGHIVRQLHDSLRELGYDRSLSDIATEVTDAAGRLEYIATLTEQAANKVLNSIDEAMPVQDEVISVSSDLESRWSDLFEGKLGVEEFKTLARDSRQFIGQARETGEAEKARLMTIMMAQDFQDITGQIIKKVVTITQKLERELAQLLIDNAPQSNKEKVVDLLAGPDVPTSALAQTDVDDLLADLGF